MTTRRKFIKKSAFGSAATLALGNMAFAKIGSHGIIGANERLNVAVIGVHNRAKAHIKGIYNYKNSKVAITCDVDEKILAEHSDWCQKTIGYRPKIEKDFRRILDNKDIDAVFIATPDHWHAPMAILALQAGKNVYVEKPCSHNLQEAKLLVEAQKKYRKSVQMGNQTRSSGQHKIAFREIQNGIIGEVYKGEAYYSNDRPSIGKGKPIEVPTVLNWELWQGPAPRETYKNNIHPYNWHWFRKWGTGEINNNGTHEIDVARWMLGVDLPISVTSFGGKYTYDDDWEFPDHQEVTFQFGGNKFIKWVGHSRGKNVLFPPKAVVYGSKGAIVFGKEDYKVFDLGGNPIGEKKEIEQSDSSDTLGADPRTVAHVANFFNSIRVSEQLNSPIADASISTALCHYGNIAQNVGHTININQDNGTIPDDSEAMSYWGRKYEKGWEPKL